MDTLFEGRIEQAVTMKDLLKRVIELRPAGVSFLRISSADKKTAGRIMVLDGDHIVGATLTDAFASSYSALRTLLTVELGNFALIATKPSDKLELDRSINIEVRDLLHHMDALPMELSTLFDEKSLLNKVFKPGLDDPSLPVVLPPPAVAETSENNAPPEGAESAASLRSFIDGQESRKAAADPEVLAELEGLVHSRFNNKTTAPEPTFKQSATGQLRALSKGSRLQAKKAMRNVMVAAIATISLVAVSGICWKMGVLNRQSLPSLPTWIHPDATANKARPTTSLGHSKKPEASANAKPRSAIEKRRL